MSIPCIDCITLPICKSLMINNFLEDYRTLCRRCESIREYLNYEKNHKRVQVSDKFFSVQDYIYLGILRD